MSNNINYSIIDNTDFKFEPTTSMFNPDGSLKNIQNFNSKLPEPKFNPIHPTPPPIQQTEIDNIIRNYVLFNNPKVYILTPCYGGMCHINYMSCLMQTIETLNKYGIKFKIEFCKNDSLVSRARNNLVARAMNDASMTHIMFIDSDISWDPVSIIQLLLDNKELIGGIYPLKHYDWNKLVKDPENPNNKNIVQTWLQHKNNSQLKDLLPDEIYIQNKLLKYNVNYLENNLAIEQNIAKVRHIATGFMMIKRIVIEQMSKAFPSTKYTDDVGFLTSDENKFAFALFDCGVCDGHYYSEDWLFCNRWSKMKKDIFINVSIHLTHTGPQDFIGSFISSIL
jgi:hypothetical protein